MPGPGPSATWKDSLPPPLRKQHPQARTPSAPANPLNVQAHAPQRVEDRPCCAPPPPHPTPTSSFFSAHHHSLLWTQSCLTLPQFLKPLSVTWECRLSPSHAPCGPPLSPNCSPSPVRRPLSHSGVCPLHLPQSRTLHFPPVLHSPLCCWQNKLE